MHDVSSFTCRVYDCVYGRGSEREGACRVYGSKGLKPKFHGSRELKQAFLESCEIQRLILFVAHIVLQNF